jgi:hypothetical protein
MVLIAEGGDARIWRQSFLQQLKPLRTRFAGLEREAGDVAAWP